MLADNLKFKYRLKSWSHSYHPSLVPPSPISCPTAPFAQLVYLRPTRVWKSVEFGQLRPPTCPYTWPMSTDLTVILLLSNLGCAPRCIHCCCSITLLYFLWDSVYAAVSFLLSFAANYTGNKGIPLTTTEWIGLNNVSRSNGQPLLPSSYYFQYSFFVLPYTSRIVL